MESLGFKISDYANAFTGTYDPKLCLLILRASYRTFSKPLEIESKNKRNQ